MASANVAIIGAGIVGTMCACFLRRDGHAVTLYDRDTPGGATSFGNSGILSPAAVVPIATPGLLRKVPRWLLDKTGPLTIDWRELPRLTPWLMRFLRAGREAEVRRISAALAALNGETLDLLQPLLQEAGLAALVEQKGLLYAYRSQRELEGDALAIELRRASGQRIDILSAAEIRDLEPNLSADFTNGAFLPDTAHTINPHRLVTDLAGHLQRLGGTLVRADVDHVGLSSGDGATVRAGGEARNFDAAIIAAGIWSKRLVAPLGYRVALESQRGYHVTVADPGISLSTAILPVTHGATIVPMEMGIRIGGTVEFAGMATPARAHRANALMANLKATFPHLNAEKHTTWMGHRPCTPDSLPVLGRAPRHPAILFAFGHGHQGLLGASKTAQIIADLVAERAPAIDLTPFAIDRF